MNKLKTLLTWGLLMAATHVMGYTITVDPIEINAGQSTNLIINLSNTETNLTAYQMKVFLPDGVTVQKKSNGKYAYTANADRTDPDLFTFSVKDAADGSVLIAVFSPDKDLITGTSGELIRLPLVVASTVTTSLQGSIKNIEFTDVQSQAHTFSNVNFTMTMEGGDTPPIVTGDVVVSVPSVSITAGSSANLIINMTTTLTNLTAYQMKVFLPDGVTVQKKSNGKYAYTANADRTDPDLFTFSVKDAADGSVLIAVFSPDKDVITGASGELIRLPIDVASTVTTSLQGSIQNIEFTNVNAQAYNLDDVTISFILSNAGQPSPNITFADANVKALCVANWDTNGDGELSEAEAAAVTSLGEAFKENAEITSFDEFRYFTGVTELPNWNSFNGCSSLQSIVVPAGVTMIFGGSFANCSALKHISVDANNSVYDSRNDCNAIIETTNNKLVVGCETTQIPNTVTTIGSTSFWGRWGMSTMTIPASVTTIEAVAFAWCPSLFSITIPANVTAIGNMAFTDCNNLVSVTVGNPSPVAIDENTFTNRANAMLFVPSGCKAAYEAADYWKEFRGISDSDAMVDIVKNGDLEGTDVSCFYGRDVLCGNNGSTPLYDPLPATISEGEGKDGSSCIKIQSADNPAQTWDTQFFIRLPQTLSAGTKYHVSFDYKASKEAYGTTQVHVEPGDYIHNEGIGNVNFTTDWQHFDFDGTISAQQSPADNPMRTIAFNLAEEPTATTYYFDNIVVEIDDFNYEPEETVIEVTDISQLDNVIYIEPMEEMTGSETAISIKMKNTAAIRGFQFDLMLPEGVTPVVEDNVVLCDLNEDRAPQNSKGKFYHDINATEQSDGSYRVLCGSQQAKTFLDTDGEVAVLYVNIASDMAEGDYPVVLKNIKLTETDISISYQTEEVVTKLSVFDYIPGDINGDRAVDVSDYIGVANHILGNTPSGFNSRAADVNADNAIDVSDYIGIANIILTGSIYGHSNGAARFMDNRIGLDPQ